MGAGRTVNAAIGVQCLLLGRLASAATCRAADSQPLQLSSSWYSQHLSAVLHFVLVLCERIVQR
jgi:hypothetical protein